jgi:hypothetical protein
MPSFPDLLLADFRPEIGSDAQPMKAPEATDFPVAETLFETLCRLAATWAR